MQSIYCATCGEAIGKTDITEVAQIAKDTIICEDCVADGQTIPEPEEDDEEEVEAEEETEQEKEN